MTLKIYKLDASAPCRAVFMTAEALNLKYVTEEVNILVKDNHKHEYVEKNPLHTIPSLEDRDLIIADSHPISTYLVSKHGGEKQAELYPNDLAVRVTIDQRLFFDATSLFPAVGQIVGEILGQKLPAPSEKKIAAANENYAVLEKYLEKTGFLASNHVTLADIALVATASTLATLVPVDDKYQNVKAWLNKLQNEEWYQKGNVPGLAAFTELLETAMARNKQQA